MQREKTYKSSTTWRIGNYRYSWHTVNEYLQSELFTISRLNGYWRLNLYPRGKTTSTEFIGIFLERVSEGPNALTVDYEISVLGSDGEPKYTRKAENRVFVEGQTRGFSEVVRRQDVIGADESTVLPEGRFTVKCCVSWKSSIDIEIEQETNSVINSIVLFSRHMFLWDAGEFNYLSPSKQGTFSKRTLDYSDLSLKLNSDSINVHIECKDNTRMFRFRISIMDGSKSDRQFQIDEYVLPLENQTVETFLISRSKLLLSKDLYLSEDRLMLYGECHYTFGIYGNELDCNSHVGILPVEDNSKQGPSRSQVQSRCCDSNYDSMKNDFQNLYQEGTVADLKIKVGSEIFEVHKAVLCARSPFFKAMLAETEKNEVDLSNLEMHVVRRMLKFMYTDKADDLNWKTAIELYSVGNNFGITMLKSVCAEFLKINLIAASDEEIQELVNSQPDADLKKVASEYLRQSKEEASKSLEHLPTHSQNPS